jgi:hypothetical protein
MSKAPGTCHCGAPARSDGSDYDGSVCEQWPICEQAKQARRSEVFDLVKPQPNWKYPIDAVVPPGLATEQEVIDAVVWFAGGMPDVAPGQGGCLVVTGAGYYEWIGA